MVEKTRARRRRKLEFVTDPVESARAANLRYVNDGEPGIRRRRAGKGFSYSGPDGQPIRGREARARIAALAIPPAWTDVWICADADGHIQATGRDANGRKQYRYHARWRELRDQTKFDRMILFGEALPRIRARVADDLKRPGLPREKVLAAVVALLGSTFIRVGNLEYARDNESFGLTTMRDDHVTVNGTSLHFEFRGKSGREHAVDLKDRRLAKIVKRSQDLPGEALFQYTDASGTPHAVTSSDVNAYLREISGESFTAKDFRTWGGTMLAIRHLCAQEPFETETQYKKHLVQMYRDVARQLGNTVAVCRKYYVHPAVLDCYHDGALRALVERVARNVDAARADGLDPDEALVMALLRERLRAAA